MKGIILAGGEGTRLYPLTKITSKQLLPIYDKPMIYYPLSTLMLAGINDILIITTPNDLNSFKKLLGSGENFGIKLSYLVQPKPEGLAQALIIGEQFLSNDSCALILGDNIFYGNGFVSLLKNMRIKTESSNRATLFGYYVQDPERFGVVSFDKKGNVESIEEKPNKPKSNYAITGLYFYPVGVSKLAKHVVPSSRGELEISSLNDMYLQKKQLDVEILGRGFAWLDTGTIDSLIDAADFVRIIEKRQGVNVSAPEEIAYRNGWISRDILLRNASLYENSMYGQHLKIVATERF